MHKFSWRTLLIFVIGLLLGVMLIGLGTAYIAKLKQQRRELSDTSLFTCHLNAETDLHLKV
jgi:CHASE1-domain containing sensor protein